MILDFTSGAIQQLPTAMGQGLWTWSGPAGVTRLGPFRVVAAQQYTAGSVETETYAPGAVAGQTRQSGGAATEVSP